MRINMRLNQTTLCLQNSIKNKEIKFYRYLTFAFEIKCYRNFAGVREFSIVKHFSKSSYLKTMSCYFFRLIRESARQRK